MATATITLDNYLAPHFPVEEQVVHTSDTGFWFCRYGVDTTGEFDYVSKCLLDAGVGIEDWTALSSFIRKNPETSGILTKLPTVASRVFEGKFHSMSFEVFSDPEDEYAGEEVFLKIDTSLSPQDANVFLSELNQYLISLGVDAVKINTTVNYV